MKEKLQFWLDIKPEPQERVRFHFKGWGKNRRILPYIPTKTREFQDGVRAMVREYMEEFEIPEFGKTNPLEMTVVFYLTKPKSAPKSRTHPVVRPDLSNYLKSLEDGLQRAVKDDDPALMVDDSAICRIICEKKYCDDEHPEAGIMVTVGELG